MVVDELLKMLPEDFSNVWFFIGFVLTLTSIGSNVWYVNGSFPTLLASEELFILMFSGFVSGGVQLAYLSYRSAARDNVLQLLWERFSSGLGVIWRAVAFALLCILTLMVAGFGSIIVQFWQNVHFNAFVNKSVREGMQWQFERSWEQWVEDIQVLFTNLRTEE